MFNQSLFTYLVRAMVLLTAIPIHECAHAWASNKLGDPTAKNLGRLTLNPLPHLDLIGSVLMLFTGFGWACVFWGRAPNPSSVPSPPMPIAAFASATRRRT